MEKNIPDQVNSNEILKERNEILLNFRDQLVKLNSEIRTTRRLENDLPENILERRDLLIQETRTFLEILQKRGITYSINDLKWLGVEKDDPILKNPYHEQIKKTSRKSYK